MAREAPPSAREAPPSGLSLRCCAVFHSTSRKWRVTFSMTGALPALCPPWTGWSPCGIQLWDRTRESPPSCLPATRGPVGPGAESCAPRPCPRFPGERWPVAAPCGCLPPGLHLPRGPPLALVPSAAPPAGLPVRTEEDRRSSLPSLKAEQSSLLLASCRCPRPHVPASSTAPSKLGTGR